MVQALARLNSVLDEAPAYLAGHLALSVSVFADRTWLRQEMAEDAAAAGFRLTHDGPLAELRGDASDGDARPLGEVVLIDAPLVDGATLAALARVDMRAAHAGAQIVVSTSLSALDDVFGCLDQSGAQVLVEPTRAERVIALGRVLAAMPRGRVRELSEIDRLTLLRLTEQVAQIAERLDRLSPGDGQSGGPNGTWSGPRLESPAISFVGAPVDDASERLVRDPARCFPIRG